MGLSDTTEIVRYKAWIGQQRVGTTFHHKTESVMDGLEEASAKVSSQAVPRSTLASNQV